MLCDQSVPLEQRVGFANNYMGIIYQNITGTCDTISLKNYLTAIHYITKGLLANCELPILEVFSNLLEALLVFYKENKRQIEDQIGVQIINLFQDSVFLFKDINFVKLSGSI